MKIYVVQSCWEIQPCAREMHQVRKTTSSRIVQPVHASVPCRENPSLFVTLRDCCPEQGNLHAFIECLNLAQPKGAFSGLIRNRDAVSSLSFKGSQHTRAGGSPHNTGLRRGSPCPGMLQMSRVVVLFFPWEKLSPLPFSALCLIFLSCLLSFPLPRAGTALLAPTEQNTRSMDGEPAGLNHIQRDFQRFMAMKIHFSSKDAAKVLGQVGVFRQRIRKKSHLKALGSFPCLLPEFTSPEQTALPLPAAAVVAR